MKKFLLLILLVLIVGPPVAWRLQKDRTVNMTVVDESVTDEMRTHHKGLIWLAEHLRIRDSELNAYGPDDYFGYFPESGEKIRRLEEGTLEDTDILFITDARGVWRSDLEKLGILHDRRREELLHSGLSRSEIEYVVDYINSGRRAIGEALLLYAEHEGGERSRQRLAEAFGVEWTGWIGGWFNNMNSVQDLPFWVRTMYERNTGELWSYTGPGVVLIKPETSEFVVLTPGIELREPRPEIIISRRMDALAEGVESGVPLRGWFEIVDAGMTGEVLAMIRLKLTGIGERVLDEADLLPSFPAVVVQRVTRDTYYLAADMSSVPTWLGPAQVKWMAGIRSQFSTVLEKGVAGELAFWKFYIPFMSNILNEAAH